ncbi:head-tail connector protein [Flavobacterium hiemivividum]|uniref:Uncharacterized protein n=1 Tax=Flavobacterium hiemivividum TaxID=2541734 RepID=A0A4R5CTS7_9FLAO|nr:hypothetical protein [Flavobacterium hiemivividum]TDE01133.1 hypothetical protein E0F98_15440 [Flavobacterium hiemivividum]
MARSNRNQWHKSNRDIQILDRINESDRKEILNQIFTEKCTSNDYYNYELLVLIIDLFKQYEISINYNIVQEDLLLRLWENKIINYFPFESIYNNLISFKNYYYSTNSADEKSKYFSKASAYIDKITNADFKNILAKTHFEKDTINEKDTFQTVTFFIDLISDIETKNEYIAEISNKADSYYKLQLFILDYTYDIDYNDVVIYTGLLSSTAQKLFFKKTIKLIAEKKLQLTIEDLQKITTIDYQTSEYAKEIDGVGLDFTLSVILKIIVDLKNGTSTSRNTVFDIVASYVKRPKDLLVIDGFFEKCTGKTIIEKLDNTINPETKEVAEHYITIKKEKFLPRFSTYCDGVKATIKGTETPALCKKSGFEFWWCENSQCFDPCRTKHNSNEWRQYTLEDILRVLQIPFNEGQYEIMLNVINRVNRFLSHLSCKKCNSILKPKGKSNYAFYGVTHFSCKNVDCTEIDKDIYLSHCLNGKCEDIIDSRDSVKCKTHGYGEECGWYICKNCNACCSSEKLVARKSYLEKFGQEYKCHIEGHRNRGILCCSDCGTEMIEPKVNSDLYVKQLNWFIEHKDKHVNITKYGQRPKDNKWWFIWRRGQFSYDEYRNHLEGLIKSGFNIPDFNDKMKDSQLIAEPFEETKFSSGTTFVCPECDNRFDLNTFNFTRKNAIQSFHNVLFKHIEI